MNEKIREIKDLHDKRFVFRDRFQAGEFLGLMLQNECGSVEDGMVLAIPSGGVPVGLKVGGILGIPFDMIVVRKLQIPGNPEAGFGAMTLDGTVFINETLMADLHLAAEQIEAEKSRVRRELEKRDELFRKGRPFPDLAGKIVIVVDDGVASGFTMLASVAMAKKAKAREIVVAVPTAPQRSIDLIQSEVDKVYCANIRTALYFAVAEAYKNWHDLNEKEVLDLLEP